MEKFTWEAFRSEPIAVTPPVPCGTGSGESARDVFELKGEIL